MSQKGTSDLSELLEGITIKIGEFTDAIKGSSTQLDRFSKTIDSKVVSLNENITALTEVIKDEDKKLSKNLRVIIGELREDITSFKEEVKISDIKDTLSALQKLVKIPEKHVINKTVDKVMKEVSEIVKELKGSK